jgi:hypothetical protein
MVFSPTKPINSKGNKPGAMPEFMEWNEKEVAKQLVSIINIYGTHICIIEYLL